MQSGRVASIHLHPEKSGAEMLSIGQIDVVAEKGIAQDKRYFGRCSANGQPSKRQVTLIEREVIAGHAATLKLPAIAPGAVRSNIETEDIDLVPLKGKKVQIGSARLLVGEPRDPCEKMDRIMPGLRALMEDDRQGVLARVIGSGTIRVGDEIRVISEQT
jgi:MOSC domain-containing protein YiiM